MGRVAARGPNGLARSVGPCGDLDLHLPDQGAARLEDEVLRKSMSTAEKPVLIPFPLCSFSGALQSLAQGRGLAKKTGERGLPVQVIDTREFPVLFL